MKQMMKHKYYLFGLLILANSALYAEDIEASMSWLDLQKTGFAVTGIVESVTANVGSRLKAGDEIARLDLAPFNYNVQYCQAAINKLQPALFDAKTELDQAKELFERTVLSETELSKIGGVYKSLKAEELMLQAECELKQWQAERGVLKAQEAAYILSSNIYPGMVISDENKSAARIELVSANKASAISVITAKQAQQYKVGDALKVIVDGQAIAATVQSIYWQKNAANQYLLSAAFYYAQQVEPGKAVTLRFE